MPLSINFPSDTGDTGRPERQKRDGEGKREGDGNGHKLGRPWRGAAGTLPGDLARGHSDSDGHGHGMGPHLSRSLICQGSFRPCLACLPHSAAGPIFRSNIRSVPEVASLSRKLNRAVPKNLERVRSGGREREEEGEEEEPAIGWHPFRGKGGRR